MYNNGSADHLDVKVYSRMGALPSSSDNSMRPTKGPLREPKAQSPIALAITAPGATRAEQHSAVAATAADGLTSNGRKKSAPSFPRRIAAPAVHLVDLLIKKYTIFILDVNPRCDGSYPTYNRTEHRYFAITRGLPLTGNSALPVVGQRVHA